MIALIGFYWEDLFLLFVSERIQEFGRGTYVETVLGLGEALQQQAQSMQWISQRERFVVPINNALAATTQ